MKISIIVCTFNREKYFPDCLDHLRRQNCAAENFEIIIVNNNSTDSTDEISKEFMNNNPNLNVTYLIEKNPGLSWARNKGAINAQGEVIVYLDDDSFAAQDYVKKAIEFYNKYLNVYGFGGRTYPQYENGKPKWMNKFLLPLVAAVDKGDLVKPFGQYEFPIGANMSFRKECLDEIGYFDTELGRKGKNMLGGEEKDFFNRFRVKFGNPYYSPNTIVNHIIPASRLTKEAIKKQGLGVGLSEKIRISKGSVITKLKKYFSEIFKWTVTMILVIFYFFSLQFAKMKMIVIFRIQVSKGLFLSHGEQY